jgi:hypothetical protein
VYLRVTRGYMPPEQIERSITDISEWLLPAAGQAEGYVGSVSYVNRDSGETRGLSFWQSAAALAACARWISPTERQLPSSSEWKLVDVERFQLVRFDRVPHAAVATCTRVDNGYTALERQGDWARFVEDEVIPAVRASSGLCSLAICVDRTSGAVAVASDWESADDREAAGPSFLPVLARAAEFTLVPIRLELFDRVIAQLHVGAAAAATPRFG